MKLLAFSSALIIALLSISSVMAADSTYLEERMKQLHEPAQTATMAPTKTMTRRAPSTMGARANPAAIISSDPWWQ